MKKIIIMLVIASFLTSCWTKNTENETNSWATDTEINQETDTDINVETTQSGQTIDVNWEIKVSNWTTTTNTNNNTEIKVENNTDTNTKVTPEEEAALENEVNDLLDEFINSLDTYDK